jgi:hypothetical protein
MGTEPAADEVAHIGECIKRSYTSMRILADRCVKPRRVLDVLKEAVA